MKRAGVDLDSKPKQGVFPEATPREIFEKHDQEILQILVQEEKEIEEEQEQVKEEKGK